VEYPRLTSEQLAELERQLVAAETEANELALRGSFRSGEALKHIEFKACEYLRRLLEDVKSYRETINS
jgi:hypothetical protein